MHILITGAAGSGTSTLAAALAVATGSQWLEADDYFWCSSVPPYQHKRDESERVAALLNDMGWSQKVVVAGSILGWGQSLEDAFDLIVFLYVPTPIRLARLKQREELRFGTVDAEFLAWAAQYDEGTAKGRSLMRHRQWLQNRKCPVLHLEGDLSTAERLQKILAVQSIHL